jgi:hypothetical protein
MVRFYTHYKELYIGIDGYDGICWKNDILNIIHLRGLIILS